MPLVGTAWEPLEDVFSGDDTEEEGLECSVEG